MMNQAVQKLSVKTRRKDAKVYVTTNSVVRYEDSGKRWARLCDAVITQIF